MDVLIGKRMTLERATAFGAAWNSRDPDLIANGRDEIRRGVQIFFDRFPDGRSENVRL